MKINFGRILIFVAIAGLLFGYCYSAHSAPLPRYQVWGWNIEKSEYVKLVTMNIGLPPEEQKVFCKKIADLLQKEAKKGRGDFKCLFDTSTRARVIKD